MERKALEMEKSRGADDQVDQMSQALNRLRTAPSVHPRPRAYARIDTPIRSTPQVRTTLCLDSFDYRGAYLPCVPE
jgi:hypothetical protein